MKQPRNFGIDLLRIVSMLMVVMLHVLGQGGILNSVKPFSCNYYIANLLETLSYGAVDCFAIISGYVGLDSRFRYANIITLWRKVAFYTITIAAVSMLVDPHNADGSLLLKAFFPVVTSHYWYVTAYFGLFFLTPFINKLVQSLSIKELDRCTVTVFALFSLIPMVSDHSLFYVNGYSLIWLVICYYMGAYLKKRDLVRLLSGRKGLLCLLYLGCIAVTYAAVIMNDFVLSGTSGAMEDTLLNYTSPTILISSVIMVLLFADLSLHAAVEKIVKRLSPLAFNVYIIHCNIVIWNRLANSLTAYANMSPIRFVPFVIVSVLGIYTACSAIDMIREAVDKKLDLRRRIDLSAENKLSMIKTCLKQKMM